MTDLRELAKTDVTALLTHDHRGVEALFAQLEDSADPSTRARIGQRIIAELSAHAAVEEMLFYPTARRLMDEGLVEHGIEEHQELKEILAGLDGKGPSDAGFMEGFHQARAAVADHVADEEGQMFPLFREQVDDEERARLAERVAMAKEIAPTHPHPHSPNRPPFNLVMGPVAATVDKVKDALRS